MGSPRNCGAALTAALVIAGVSAGAAQATTENVVPTVRHEMRVVKRAAASENLKHIRIRTRAEARRAEPKFRMIATTLDRAATVVSRASTDSAAQRRGKRDWVTGVRGVARGEMQLVGVLKDLARGDRVAAKDRAMRVGHTFLVAGRLLVRADRLLHVR